MLARSIDWTHRRRRRRLQRHSSLSRETDTQSRVEWISTLDELQSPKPKAVIAGHKVPENDDDPRIIAETRQYLRDFNRLNATTTTARQLYDAMLEIYPDRVNPGSLWGAANTAKKPASSAAIPR